MILLYIFIILIIIINNCNYVKSAESQSYSNSKLFDLFTPSESSQRTQSQSQSYSSSNSFTPIPSQLPTQIPTQIPTQVPTQIPTQVPTNEPNKIDYEILFAETHLQQMRIIHGIIIILILKK
jgi:hypothetical protein